MNTKGARQPQHRPEIEATEQVVMRMMEPAETEADRHVRSGQLALEGVVDEGVVVELENVNNS